MTTLEPHLAADHRQATGSQRVSVPAQRRLRATPGDRLRRQVEAIDAWHEARHRRESELACPDASRQEREAARRELDVLRRTQHALEARTAEDLARDGEARTSGMPTAVIAHRHAWFAGNLATFLRRGGVVVVACTSNGAEALGAVIAEQPDVLLTGDRLEMMIGADLLAGTRRFAPATRCAVHAASREPISGHGEDAVVFLDQLSSGDVADELLALLHASPSFAPVLRARDAAVQRDATHAPMLST